MANDSSYQREETVIGVAAVSEQAESSDPHLAVVVSPGDYPVEFAVSVWLDAKFKLSESQRTRDEYERTFTSFARALASAHLEVTSPPREVALLLQAWAAWSVRGRKRTIRRGGASAEETTNVTANTFNRQLAIISSFYTFAQKRQLLTLVTNPVDLVDRRKAYAYASARPISPETMKRFLAEIREEGKQALQSGNIREVLRAQRDFTLLSVAAETGRRVSELIGLRWKDVQVELASNRVQVTLTFYAKGGKTMHDTLPLGTGEALLHYLCWLYGGPAWSDLRILRNTFLLSGQSVDAGYDAYVFAEEPADLSRFLPSDDVLDQLIGSAPVWVSLAHDGSAGHPLSRMSVSLLCKKRINTGKVHTLRHSFAHAMQDLGAPMSVIQDRLGHASLAVTGRYLAAIGSSKNEYGEQLAALFGTDIADETEK